MFQLLFALLIVGLLWFFMSHHQQSALKQQIKQELPTSDTVQGFHSDVQRAQAEADKVNQMIKKQGRDIKRDIQQVQ